MKSRTSSMQRFGLFIIPLTALVVYMVASTRPVHATFLGTNGQIAFVQGDPNANVPTASVFIANPDGSNPQQVPLGDPIEFRTSVIWSPDGTKLLIDHTIRFDPSTSQCCLPFRPAIVGFDGSNYTLLAIPDGPFDMGCDVWSRDQTRLLCNFGDLNGGVFSIQASDGGDPIRLTTNPYSAIGGMDVPADMSPDGTRFVFLRFKPAAGPSSTPLPDQQVALFVENVNGTGLRQITPFFLSERPSANWSPDGLKIISEMSNGAGGTANRLFLVDPNGRVVTPINLQVGTQKYSAFQPVWSPDGTRIIFNIFINGGNGIYTANPDGSNVKKDEFTTDFAAFFNSPDWGTHPVTP